MRQVFKKMTAIALMGLSQAVMADDYPTRPISLVIGFGAGGPTDVVGRLVAKQLESELGQPVVVDNRAGANGLVALQFVKRAKPDGYTILMGSSGSLAIEPAFKKKIDYNVFKDFVPTAPLAQYPYLLVVAQDSPFQTVADLVKQARASKVPMSFASAGIGADNHLAGEWFASVTGSKLLHVPYKGGDAPAVLDMVAKRVDFAFLSAVSALPQIKGGKLRALAVADDRRAEFIPGVPTVNEAAKLQNFVVGPWNGLLLPAGASPAVVAKLNKAVNRVMATEEVRAALMGLGQYPFLGTPEEFGTFIRQKQVHWTGVVDAAGLERVE